MVHEGNDLLEPREELKEVQDLATVLGRGIGSAARVAVEGLSNLVRVLTPRKRPRRLPPAGDKERREALLREMGQRVAEHGESGYVSLANDERFWQLVKQLAALGAPPPPAAGPTEAEVVEASAPALEPPRKKGKKKKPAEPAEEEQAAAEDAEEGQETDLMAGVFDGMEGEEGEEGADEESNEESNEESADEEDADDEAEQPKKKKKKE